MKKNDIHSSILAAFNGEAYTPKTTEMVDDDGETMTIERFTFGDHEPTLLEAIKAIIELSENSELSNEFFFEAGEALDYVADRLDINQEQALMLALLVNNFTDQHIDVTDFGRHLRCKPISLLPILGEMDGLENRGLMVCNRSGNRPTYRIPYSVLEALNKNETPQVKLPSGISCDELMIELDSTFDQRCESELTFEGMKNRCHALLASNHQLHFVEEVESYGLNDNEYILLLYMACQCVISNDNRITLRQLHELYDHRMQWNNIRQLLQGEKTRLQQRGIVDFAHDEGFGDHSMFCLTMTAKRALFTELDINITEDDERPQRGVTNHRDITERQLFYDEATSRQIDELTGLLDDEHYQLIHQRLQEQGFRCGFTCLFYGSPGTGKTETVLQLARRTQRNIMQVNVSEIKSKWVGDSEKNIKALFDDYRRIVKDSKLTPILLFNEADAIINRRQENAERGVDKMENSIQNIILQEMETLDGILIATTNLEQNMDRAFERRFLYKIQFQKPTAEARRHIWHELIPSLSDDAISQLASRYDFSGGQIENIARHHAIDSILHGSEADDLSTLISHCDQERLEKQRPKVGF